MNNQFKIEKSLGRVLTEEQMAMSWAFRNGIFITLEQIKGQTYTHNFRRDGKAKKVSLNKVKIKVRYDNSVRLGDRIYKQDEAHKKVAELYLYYWHESKDYIKYLKNLI